MWTFFFFYFWFYFLCHFTIIPDTVIFRRIRLPAILAKEFTYIETCTCLEANAVLTTGGINEELEKIKHAREMKPTSKITMCFVFAFTILYVISYILI